MAFVKKWFLGYSLLVILLLSSFSPVFSQSPIETIGKSGGFVAPSFNGAKLGDKTAAVTRTYGTGNGFMAPAFSGIELGGRAISLEDYTGENLLLVFASPGCPYCKKKVSLLNSIVEDGDMKVLMVLSADAEKAANFKREQGAKFKIIADGDYKISQTYGIKSVPQAFLIEEDGSITFSTISNGGSIWSQLGSSSVESSVSTESLQNGIAAQGMELNGDIINAPIQNESCTTNEDCDLNLFCSHDYCGPNGRCVHVANQNSCLFRNGYNQYVCLIDGDNFGSYCRRCYPSVNQYEFTPEHDDVPCSDGSNCSSFNSCLDGYCHSFYNRCSDELYCTIDHCEDNGGCSHYLVFNHCLINGQCYLKGDVNPENSCQQCNPFENQHEWTNNDELACSDGISCTRNDHCSSGTCLSTPYECDDWISCTLNICREDDCWYPIDDEHCIINNECIAEGTINPSNPCQSCIPAISKTSWSNEDSLNCNDGDSCTRDDHCSSGTCLGTNYECSDGLSCTLDVCSGNGTCMYILQESKCLINGVCYNRYDDNQGNPCQVCRDDKGEYYRTHWYMPDMDSDGVCDFTDNCLKIANSEQADWDEDGKGDKCDAMGLIRAWGQNDYHQTDAAPIDGGYIAVEAGISSSIALKQNGSIAAWGRNKYGERSYRPSGNDFVAISLSCYHCLALKEDGSVVAWAGSSDYGQTSPPARNDIVAIGTGMYHSIALTEAGNIIAWGDNWYHQTEVPAGNDFVAISANDNHSVALRENGTIVSWGYNVFGQVSNTPTGNDFIAVSAGVNHSIALKSDGSIVAWGAYSTSYNAPPAGNNYVAISAGYNNNLALRNDGTLAAWGENYDGQTSPLPAGNTYTAISSGDSFNTAIMNCNSVLDGDIDFDCYTNLKDVRVLSLEWLQSTGTMNADINDDNNVDFEDFGLLADDWMRCSYPLDTNCD